MSAGETTLPPGPSTRPPPARLAPALARLLGCGVAAAIALGAFDVVAHGPSLRWFEVGEIVAIYALFGGAATLVALPFAALLLLLLRPWLGLGRSAALLLWVALVGVIVAALDLGALTVVAAFVALALVSLVAERASTLRWFERAGGSRGARLARVASALALLLLVVAPPIGRRLAAAPAGERTSRASGRPDVVLIVLDTLRADHLGAYGDRRGLSPNFDRFAAEGALYGNCFSSAPWTVPSHASLFTGLHPPTHGCSFEHHRWLDDRFTTLAEAFESCDYQTAAFVANDYLFKSNLLQGFHTRASLGARSEMLAIRPLLELLGWPARFCDHGAREAVERIDGFLAAPRDDQPLFLFVNLLEAHWRYLPALAQRLAQTQPEPGVVAATRVSSNFYGPLVMAGKHVAGPVEPSIRALYAAAVAYQDELLGELLALLGRRLDLDHTVVAITADHGENLGDGGRWDHVFAVNDALVHVPLAIRYPRAFPAGARVDGLCQLVDVPVTLFALTNQAGDASLGEGLAGRTLVPARFQPRDVVLSFGDPYLGHFEAMAVWSGFNRDVLPFSAVQRSIRDASHKLVRSSVRGEELFELAADRDETQDVGASEPAKRDALRARLDAELQALVPYEGPPQLPPQDAHEPGGDEGRLNALGYVSERAGKRRPPR